MSDPLFTPEAHVHLALADAALPRKQAEQRKEGALKDAFPRKTPILLMTTIRAWPHETNLKGLQAGKT